MIAIRPLRHCTFALAALLLLATAAQAAPQRVALVIGNGAYAEGALKNPINDARAMAATLRELDFEVSVLENGDRAAMQRAVVEFGRKLREDTVGLFYFAGHGMQVRGSNYLIPVNSSIDSEEEVEVEAVDVNYVMSRMALAKSRFNIVILDACRNNPFQRSFRSANNGLAAISAPTGTLIAYATAPGSVASDGEAANGIYTSELVSAIRRPGLSMEEAFKQARSRVIQRSQGKQTPWESSSVVGEFSFRPVSTQQVAAATGTATVSSDAAREIAYWNSIKDSQDGRDFQFYIEKFPNGAFNKLARIRISNLPDPYARKGMQTASLGKAPVSSTPPVTDAASYEAALKNNWAAVHAALKKHMDDNFEVYRNMIPARNSITGLRLSKSTLYDIVDAGGGRVNIFLEGQRYDMGTTQMAWIAFSAVLGYEIKIIDGKVVIGDYRYISRT